MSSVEEEVNDQGLILIGQCQLPKFTDGEDKRPEKEDFVKFVEDKERSFEQLKNHFADLFTSDLSKLFNKEYLVSLLIILGENHGNFVWNNASIRNNCSELQNVILNKIQNSIGQIMMKGFTIGKLSCSPLIRAILMRLRPKLLKENWKFYPGSVECYVWVMDNISSFHLTDVVQHVLPTALILTDDFEKPNKLCGITCLSQITGSITTADLKYYGYGDLIYRALERLLRDRDADIARITIPCTLALITKIEATFDEASNARWSRYDDAMEILLEVIELEHLIDVRKVYVSHLELIIRTLRLRNMRWCKRLLRIIDNYLETSRTTMDYSTMLFCLKALEAVLEEIKPAVVWYTEDALGILFKSLINLFPVDESAYEHTRVLELNKKCIKILLDVTEPELKEKIMNDIQKEIAPLEHGPEITDIIKNC